MQTPINSRDIALQNTVPRVLGVSTNYINLTCPTQQFKYGTDNVAQPASTVVTATLVGILKGTVTFATTGLDPVPTAVGNTLTINPDHMTGDVVTVNASMPAQGTTYQAVPVTLSRIFNQLVAKTTRTIDLLPAYTDGSGYTLPAADNFIELYNGIVKLTSNVVYGPATTTKNGLTATVNTATGLITLSQTAANAWTGTSENFTFTATRAGISYNTTYTITKAKQGSGGQQLAEAYLYQWSTTPAAPTGTSVYTWATQTHVYTPTAVNPDTWQTTVPVNPGGGVSLWKITKAVTAEASLTVTQASFTWATGTTTRRITTEANELIKTATVKVYKVDNSVGAPTPPVGTSDYAWSTKTIQAKPATLAVPTPQPNPLGWEILAPAVPPGFKLWEASVNIIDSQSASITNIDWTTASLNAVSYSGINGDSAITAVLTNDTHAIPTDSADSTRNLTNSGTDLFIYEGATALVYDGVGTAAGKFKVTAAVDGVTAGAVTAVTVNAATGARYADLAAATFDKAGTGSITFTVTGTRLDGVTAINYIVKQSFTKTPSGVKGDPGLVYWIVSSASVIQKNAAGTYNPSAVTFTTKKSDGSTTTDYTGFVKFFVNTVDQNLSPANRSTYTYPIAAGTTSVSYALYSDAGFTNLLDTETIPVVSDGSKGDLGNSARRAYVVATTTPAGTPATHPRQGDTLPEDGTWFTGKTWASTAPSTPLEAGEILYQSDGTYITGGSTTWGYPYISALKVGALSSITVNTGQLTINNGSGTGWIKGGDAESLDGANSGDGFFVDSDGYLRVGAGNDVNGNPTGARLKFDANGLAISNAQGINIFTVVSNAQIAASASADSASTSADSAGTAATKAAAAVAAAGSVTWVGDAQIEVVTGTQLKRTSGTGGWSFKKRSTESYVGGAYITFIPVTTVNDFMIGLNGDAAASFTAGNSFVNIDYAWYISGASGLKIYESGAERAVAGILTYTDTTVLSIIYDGRYVKYYRDGVLARTVDAGQNSNLKLFADTTFANNGEAKSIRFGPVGAAGVDGITPTLSVGTVSTGTAGSAVSITPTTSGTNTTLNFTIPQGYNGISYWLVTSVAAINKSSSGSFTPTYVTGTIKKNDGTTITDHAGYFKFYNNGNLVYTSTTAETSKLYNFSGVSATEGVDIYAYADSGFTQLIGRLAIPVIRDGANSIVPGPNGARGSLQGYGSKYGIYNSAWANSDGYRVIYNILAGTNFVTGADTLAAVDGVGGMRNGDTVTITNNAGTASFTRFWDGSSWIDPGVIINGNLLVTGTVGANKLASNFLEANWATIGTLRSAQSGSRVEIKSDVIKVYQGETVRVKIGNLSA